jgi:hypothetical protein
VEGRVSILLRMVDRTIEPLFESTRHESTDVKRMRWAGWLIAAALLVQNATLGLAASGPNPLEGQLLRQSDGTFYLYHEGLKFLLPVADVGDNVIDAIPTATADQWQTMFASNLSAVPAGSSQQAPAGMHYPVPPGQPGPFPGYS